MEDIQNCFKKATLCNFTSSKRLIFINNSYVNYNRKATLWQKTILRNFIFTLLHSVADQIYANRHTLSCNINYFEIKNVQPNMKKMFEKSDSQINYSQQCNKGFMICFKQMSE